MNLGTLTKLLISGVLLGDIVSEVTGEDIEVMRYNDGFEFNLVPIGVKHRYAYSTIASHRDVVLGSARVYLFAENKECYALTRGRMKQTLKRLGYYVSSYHLDGQNYSLIRIILSPVVNSKIMIVEAFRLMDIKRVLLS
jgi:hypothetical protein